MNHFTRLVIPVFFVNVVISIAGFIMFAAIMGPPQAVLHPVTGAIWTILLLTQMILAAKRHPAHKWVGRLALVTLFVSVYAAMQGVYFHLMNETDQPGRLWVFTATAIAFFSYAAIGIGKIIQGDIEAHSTAMLLAGAVSMAAGIARASGGLNAVAGIPFELTYFICAMSMAFTIWKWRPNQTYLIGSYVVLMTCVIFLR